MMSAGPADSAVVHALPGGRRLPHNIEAEMALLGAILVNNRAFERVADVLDADHFAYEPHRRIFAACRKAIEAGQVADPVLLGALLARDASLAEVGGGPYLLKLADAAVAVINARDYGRLIRHLALRRDAIGAAEDVIAAAYDDAIEQADLIGRAGHALSTIEAADSKLPPVCDASGWTTQPPPQRWVWEGWIPAGHVVALYGAAGTGKTLLAQQLVTCVAAGLPFFGEMVAPGRVFFLAAEDPIEVFWRRQVAINRELGLHGGVPADRMQVWSVFGHDACLMHVPPGEAPRMTPLHAEFRRRLLAFRPDLTVVDTAAATFGGDEIKRSHVTAYISACLGSLALQVPTTILVNAHPPKEGGTFSGSTAWEASVRARLHFQRSAEDPERRVLFRPKANYSALLGADQGIEVLWQEGAFTARRVSQADRSAAIEGLIGRLIAAIGRALARGDVPRRSPQARNQYAPKLVEHDPDLSGESKEDLVFAFERAVTTGRLEICEPRKGDRGGPWVRPAMGGRDDVL